MRPVRGVKRAIRDRFGFRLAVLALLLGTSCAPRWKSSAPPRSTAEDVRAVVEGNTEFALNLYAKLGANPSANLFFSPESLATSLAMAFAGAGGKTAEQMRDVLRFRLPPRRLHAAFSDLRQSWAPRGSDAGYRLEIANRLWGQYGLEFLPEFLTVAADLYDAEPTGIDFAQDPEQARQSINAWVQKRTQGTIPDLIPPGAIDTMTRLVLANAVHFKGDWTEPFSKSVTRPAPFHISASERADVPLMHHSEHFRYWAGEDLKALELPYGNGDVVMVVLLPDSIDGLPALEAKLTTDNLSRWLSSLRKREVDVFLPRFKMSSQFRIDDALKALGMTQAFLPGEADFSGMSHAGQLFLSVVAHKALVDVNEEGTEAAAATADMVKSTADINAEPAVFRADHPFVFLIRNRRTDGILFLGRLVDPRSGNGNDQRRPGG